MRPRTWSIGMRLFLAAGFFSGVLNPLLAQSAQDASLPKILQRDGHFALQVEGKPYLMLGAQLHNSSAWPEMMPFVWKAMDALHVNTVEAPIYWEQLEPERGKYDFSVLDMLLREARTHRVHLVLLWFGTWKNSSPHYAPEWIKLDEKRYPRVIDKSGKKMDSLSPFSAATMEEDKKAFVALMQHLKTADSQHTVIMVQVENEAGTYGSPRDFSSAAQSRFSQPVPSSLLQALNKSAGTWPEVFGADADEVFHAWAIASYIQEVAAAGKAVYPLPMSVNAALRDPLHPPSPCTYECGGPTDNVLSVWKAAAPAIDVIGPDIYMPEYEKYVRVLDLYHRKDNALFIPETGNSREYARYFFAALGNGAIGFSPFGMDYSGFSNYPLGAKELDSTVMDAFASNYKLAEPMMRQLAQWSFEGKVHGVSEDPEKHQQIIELENWQGVVSYGLPQFGPTEKPKGNPEPKGGALIVALGKDEFLVSGFFTRVEFRPKDPTGQKQLQYLKVEEGTYQGDGSWRAFRLWNGDQTDFGLNFAGAPQVLRVRLATY